MRYIKALSSFALLLLAANASASGSGSGESTTEVVKAKIKFGFGIKTEGTGEGSGESGESGEHIEECEKVKMGDLIEMVHFAFNGTISHDTDIELCHHFAEGEGYLYSMADHNIGRVHIESMVGGERDLFYKDEEEDDKEDDKEDEDDGEDEPSGSEPEKFELEWDWNELHELVHKYSEGVCETMKEASGSGNEGNDTVPAKEEYWHKLALPWGIWNETA